MSKPIVHGFPQSSYVWTTRAALEVKGVDHDFVSMQPGDHRKPAHLALHPFGKVPAFQHGDLTLYETAAIVRYVDEAFDGPALLPADAAGRARVQQWLSVVNCYFYGDVVPKLLFGGYRAQGGPDHAVIEAALPRVRKTLGLLDADVGDGSWIVGDRLTLADLYLGPLLFLLGKLPAGEAALSDVPGVQRVIAGLAATPGFMAAAPPR